MYEAMDSPILLPWVGLVTASAAGWLGIPHCAGMCGPLAFWAHGAGAHSSRTGWHFGRIAGYAAVGMLAGFLGRGIWSLFPPKAGAFAAWLLALGLVLAAFDRPFRLGLSAWGLSGFGRFLADLRQAGPWILGFLTPLLPCGLSWSLWLMAAASGSPAGGGLTATAFALASAPGPWLFERLGRGRWWTAAWTLWLRRAILLAGASLVVWRSLSSPAGSPPTCSPDHVGLRPPPVAAPTGPGLVFPR